VSFDANIEGRFDVLFAAKWNSHFPAVMSAFEPTRPLAMSEKKAPDDAGA
jgi:hypothetical protein